MTADDNNQGTTIRKSLIFVLLFPGIVLVFAPWLLVTASSAGIHSYIVRYTAFFPWVLGLAILIRCVRDFIFKGHGTPAPIDPPKTLVVDGFYKFVRNPMYVGVLLILIGHILWFQTVLLVLYGALIFLAFHLFVVFYEEPTLRGKFGDSYTRYCQKVPRWLPRMRRRV